MKIKQIFFVLLFIFGCNDSNVINIKTINDYDAIDPWYGSWYHISNQFQINAPISWENGGSSFGFIKFEFNKDKAIIRTENCLWGSNMYEYTLINHEGDRIFISPLNGDEHKFTPHGNIDQLFIEIGNNCDSLYLKQIDKDGIEVDFLTPSNESLQRGEICLDQCAEMEGDFGLISDCGVEVPWKCIK